MLPPDIFRFLLLLGACLAGSAGTKSKGIYSRLVVGPCWTFDFEMKVALFSPGGGHHPLAISETDRF